MADHFRILAISLLIALASLASAPCAGAQTIPEIQIKEDPPIEGVLDFQGCVRLALQQSPYLTASSLDIDLKRLDVSDAKYAYVPSFSLRTLYYLNLPTQEAGQTFNPYVVQFITDQYNPIEIHYNIVVRKMLTRIAILAHIQVISDYLERLAVGYLQLESLDRMVALNEEAMGVARQMVAYTRNRVQTGGASLAEVEIADQQLQMLTMEMERLAVSKTTISEGIRAILGCKPTDAPLELGLQNARYQILGIFDPAAATLEQAKSNSIELKIQKVKKELQEKSITLAYTRFIPHFVWGIQTVDPLSGRNLNGLFFTVGLEMPIWDGMKRYHDISRQKTLLTQNIAEGETKEIDLATKWREAQQKLHNAAADVQMAESKEKLAGIKLRQAEIGYRKGGQQFSAFLDESKTRLDAQKTVVEKKLEYDKAVLGLGVISGDFLNRFVSAGSCDEKGD
jgi:outer membrane protein TolC